jgi:hypothetical protein
VKFQPPKMFLHSKESPHVIVLPNRNNAMIYSVSFSSTFQNIRLAIQCGAAWVDRLTLVSHEFFIRFCSISEGFCVLFPFNHLKNAKNTKTR